MDQRREWPHDERAEQALLGAMLMSGEACASVLNIATAQDFANDNHKIIFDAIKTVRDAGMMADVTTVANKLMDQKNLDRVGGVDYLLSLADAVATVQHVDYYLQILTEKSLLRRLITETTHIAEECYNDVGDMNDFINDVERRFLGVTRDRNAGEFQAIDQVVDDVTERLRMLQKTGGKAAGVKTGYTNLDHLTGGFQKGDLIILAARPSVGKTAFALNLAHNAASVDESPDAVAVFSLEMPAQQLVNRLICCAGSIDNEGLRTGAILKDNPEKYYAAAERVKRDNLYIDDTPGIKVGEIAAKCRRLKQEEGLKLVVIDYLQLISGPTASRESRQQEVSDISRQLKALARELECPVIALSQLSRQVEQRKGKPMLSDLRESGAIEQDADIVAFLHREDYQNKEKEAETNGLTEIIVAKHRNGATADLQLIFEKQYSRFSNYTTQDLPDGGAGTRDLRV